MKKTLLVISMLLLFSGCVGVGFDKKCTLMPDEIWVSGDFNPDNNYDISEVGGGLKLKLK